MERISDVLQLPFEKVECDERGRMDMNALGEARGARRRGNGGGDAGNDGDGIGGSAAGNSGVAGEIWISRACGCGVRRIFCAGVESGGDTREESFARIGEADSIVIDPHKHGLQPYGCGCVLFRDPGVGRLYKHDSPYTYFSSAELHLGEISLECSRPGAAAAALWATQKLLPLVREGEFARGLERGREAALRVFSGDRNRRKVCSGV